MMYCTKCGNELEDSVKFCSNCGTPVEEKQGQPNTELQTESEDTVVQSENLATSTDSNKEASTHNTSAYTDTNEETSSSEQQASTHNTSEKARADSDLNKDTESETVNSAQIVEQPSKQEAAAGLETSEPKAIKSRKFSFSFTKKKMAITAGIIAAVVILSIVGLNVFLNKNPKELYLLAEWKTSQANVKALETRYEKEYALQQMLTERPSTTKLAVEGDATFSGAEGNNEFEKFRDVLKDSKLTLLFVQDPEEELGHYTLSYLLKDVNLLDAIVIQNKEHTALEVPVLFDKMFFVKNSEFGDFMEKSDPYYEGPDELSSQVYQELFTLTDEQKQRLKKKYSAFVLENLKDDYFTLTKDASYSSPDGAVDLRRIDIKMTEQEVQQLLASFIDEVRADKELHQLVAKKFVDYMKATNSEHQLSDAVTDVDYIQEEIEDGLYTLKKQVRTLEFPEGFNMYVYLNGSEEIVDRKVDFEFENDTTNVGLAFDYHSSKWIAKDDSRTGKIGFEIFSTSGPVGKIAFSGDSVTSFGKMGEKEDINATFSVVEGSQKAVDIDLEMAIFNTGEEDNKLKTDYEFDLRLDGAAFAMVQPEVEGKIKRLVDQNLDKDFSNQQVEMDVVVGMNSPYGGGQQEVGIKLDLTNEITFSDSIKEPVIANDAIDVAKLTESEWYEIQTELEESLGEFMKKNETIFNMDPMRTF